MIRKRRRKNQSDKEAQSIWECFADEINGKIPPQSLSPEELDNIIKRGNNLKDDRKIEVKKQRRKNRPVFIRTLAVVMSLLLVVGIGVGTADFVQQEDTLGFTVSTAKMDGDAAYAVSDIRTVAESEGVSADDYSPIVNYLKELKKQAEKQAEKNNRKSLLEMFEIPETTTNDTAEPEMLVEESSSAEQTKEYSDTNQQVQNVQEGDVVKTDGNFLYLLSADGRLVCEQVEKDGSLTQTDAIDLTVYFSDDPNLQELFLYQNQLAVVVQHYAEKGSQVTVVLFTVDQAGNLSESGSYSQEGNFVSARLTDGTLYLISSQKNLSIYRDYDEPEEYIPTVWNGEESRLVTTEEMYINNCPDTVMGYTSISGYRMGEDVSTMQITSVLGSSAAQVYCTEDTLYLFSNNLKFMKLTGMVDTVSSETIINSYRLEDGKAVAAAQGTVPGRMLNQFSADESDGLLRVATTDEKACRVTVLDASLQMVSELTGLAEGEDIYACKFMGDTAYLVTFYQTDPLFVLDLSDVMNMKVTGELKIPGYSSYLYPIGENYLIGVGRNADENGWEDGMRVNLFDVSDPCEPKLADVKILYGDCSSLAGETHKAYYADAANGLVGFPVYRYLNGREQFNGFVLFSVEGGKLTVEKEFDFLEELSGLDWDSKQEYEYTYNGYHIQRGVYVEDTLYLIADHSIYAYGRTDFAYLGRFDLN